jgi:signal peptidase I
MKPLTIPSRNQNDEQINTHQPVERKQATPNEKNENESFIGEVFKFALIALVIVIPFRIYIAQPFIVSGSSMFPTFHNGEYIIVDQITYRMEEPKRGDVVIFRYPNDPSKFFIKRIIGLPGEIVQLANGITTIINPKTHEKTVLDEEYLVTDKTDDHLSITLSPSEYFVMGDNRSASSDSRVWGPVPEKNLVGRALIRLLPLNSIGMFPGEYTYHYNYQHTN